MRQTDGEANALNCAVIGVGRLRERYWREAADEYVKRLSRFGRFEEIEVPDLPEPDNSSPALQAQIKRREGVSILGRIRPDDYVVALCIDGQSFSSERFSQRLTALWDEGRRVVFVIGGSLGLSEEVVARAQMRLSFSPMTFPHQLSRVMLLEQLYRACKIASGERYHK